jgi:hypothetical protein
LLAFVLATVVVGAARAMHPATAPARLRTIRASVDHYRSVAWLFQRAARLHPTPTSFSYRRSTDPAYLQWTLKQWQQREFDARARALTALRHRLDLKLPASPGLHASLVSRIAYAKTLTTRLQKVYPGHTATRSLASARPLPATQQLYKWQVKAAEATLTVSRHATHLTVIGPHWLTDSFMCIHHFEGAWDSDTGNGYYGGLQMNAFFMQRYGAEYVSRWGTADRWPAWAQIAAAVRAYQSGRGFWPWPNTARACGLL